MPTVKAGEDRVDPANAVARRGYFRDVAPPDTAVSALLSSTAERLAANAWQTEGIVEALLGTAHSDGPVDSDATHVAVAAFAVLAESIQGFPADSDSSAFLAVLAWDCDSTTTWEQKVARCHEAASDVSGEKSRQHNVQGRAAF